MIEVSEDKNDFDISTPPIGETPPMFSQNEQQEDTDSTSVFTDSPIPPRFRFDCIDSYIRSLNYPAYDDGHYAKRKLHAHFVMVSELCQQILSDFDAETEKAENKLIECFLKNLTPVKKTMVHSVANIWRRQVFLVKRKTYIEKIFNEKKIIELNRLSTIVKKLGKLAEHLLKHPRLIMFNIPAIMRFQYIRLDMFTRDQLRIKALNLALSDTKLGLVYTPRLFESPEDGIGIITQAIESCKKFMDPLTFYIPENDNSNTISDFLRSRLSPIRWTSFQKGSISNRIEITIECIRSFASIKDKNSIFALASLSARHWFNKMNTCNMHMSRSAHPMLPAFIWKMRNNKLTDFKPTHEIQKFASNYNSVVDFFEKNKKYFNGPFEIAAKLPFYNVPVDIAYNIYLINLSLQGFVASAASLRLDDPKVSAAMPFMWKIFLVMAEIPSPDAMVSFVTKWTKVAAVPEKLSEACVVPSQVLNAWVEECGPMPEKKRVIRTRR